MRRMHRGIPPCYGGVLALGVVASRRGYYYVPLRDLLHGIATHSILDSRMCVSAGWTFSSRLEQMVEGTKDTF
jgi:hypothetical protein